MQSAASTPAPTIIDAFVNESYKRKSSNDIDQDKMAALEARVRVIERVDLYNPIQVAEMCLVPNVVVLKKINVPEFIKYTGI